MADNSPNLPPLPPSWAQHVAPSGHVYYYNTTTKESTYKRPVAAVPPPPPPLANAQIPPYKLPVAPAPTPIPYLNLSDPRVANAYMAQQAGIPTRGKDFNSNGQWPNFECRPPPLQPPDKPISKADIPDCEPWMLVYTKMGRRFAYNPEKNASFWRIPEKLKPAILEMDRARILQMAQGSEAASKPEAAASKSATSKTEKPAKTESKDAEELGSDEEYEEVEVVEGEEEDENAEDENPSKRQKTDDDYGGGVTEFGEDDIAFQLQAAAAEYGEEYLDNEWEGTGEEEELSGEEATALFEALLADFHISPYSSWEKIIEEGKIIDDPRYTALHTMKARKAAWEAWSRVRIKELKEKKATEEKKDPLVTYLGLLQQHASPRLYWPEFKRKYRKEAIMRDLSLSEREKEKWYRDYVARLKLPQATLKSDFTKLLGSVATAEVVDRTLPKKITTDIRYVCLDAKVRDPLVDAFLQSL